MLGLDDKIAALSTGEGFLIVIAIAILLGLRHASDPDHLVAVSTLLASTEERSARRAAGLGISWGAGHATTLILFGLPVVIFDQYLPNQVERGAEVAIGLMIMLLALRLLIPSARDRFHSHVHRHGRLEHRHLHAHDEPESSHVAAGAPAGLTRGHTHQVAAGRSPLHAYGIGLLHGIGGSAGVGVLLLAAIPDHVTSALALLVFAAFTGISMAIASTCFGYTVSRGPLRQRFTVFAPALATLSLAFGAWYALGALQAVPYAF